MESDFMVIKSFGSKKQIIVYLVLFAVAFLTVLRVLPWQAMVVVVLLVVAGMDFKILFRADYMLLLTFVGFFIFTGNMARIDAVKEVLQSLTAGKEFFVAVGLSQVVSNVPATLMLSGFTENYKELLLGVNVGGLGTLIASMASLISFKFFSREYKEKTGSYVMYFTLINVAFLAVFIAIHVCL